MRFRNETDKERRFELRGVHYHVPPGAEIDIPDRVAYAVKRQGLPLTPLEQPPEERQEAQRDNEPAEVWRERAVFERSRAEAAEAAMRRLDEKLSKAEADLMVVSRQQAEAQGDAGVRIAGLQARVTELEEQLAAVTRDRDELLAAATKPESSAKRVGKVA